MSDDRFSVQVKTPLGEAAFTFRELWGDELVSGLFRFDVELDSSDRKVDFKKLVGEEITIVCNLPGGKERYFHGIVTRITQGESDPGATRYRLEVRPTLWLLSLQSDCRIFQEKSVPEIVKEVCQSIGYTDVRLSLSKAHAPREYCVQYRENSFDFLSRLMEDEGIFYYFKHEIDKHTLVLGDDADAHEDCPAGSVARYRISGTDAAPVDELWECTLEQRMVTESYSLDDYNFETPATNLLVEEGTKPLQLREFPGGFEKKDQGTARAKVRLQAAQAAGELLHGEGATLSFTAGHLFELKEHPRTDVNTKWMLRAVQHRITAESGKVGFTAQPKSVPFRPPRETPRPVIAGAHTAVVTGKSGEEAWTDKYGRVRLQFHWDREGTKDEKSSCWVRVSQGWAGKGWGAFFLPRVGQEVVVSFLDGDPDQPLVTGSVYNAEQTVPYALPANQSVSTVKSQSIKEGDGFNELRFEDKKDSEEVYLHAQKDLKVEVLNDAEITVAQNRKATISEGDETLEVLKGKRTLKVTEGDEDYTVGGKRTLEVTGKETRTHEDDYQQDVAKNYVLKVKGNLTIEADGTVTLKSGQAMTVKSGAALTAEAAQGLTNKAGTDLTNQAGTSLTNKAGTTLTNDAGVSLTSKAGASQKVEASGMVEVKGALVKIN